jgi:hypothetical protein
MESFDADFEAAWREAKTDMGRDPNEGPEDIALEVHEDRLVRLHSELYVRGNVTEAELKAIEAMRQALAALHILQAIDGFETIEGPTDVNRDLAVLDNVKDEAVDVLAGLGLPATWDDFIDYNGNRCRIEIHLDSCILASQNQINLLMEAMRAIQPGND